MNKIRTVLFALIILIGLVAIDQIVYPLQEGGCSCIGDEVGETLCREYCDGDNCGIWRPYEGSCSWMFCFTDYRWICYDLGTRGNILYAEYCDDCADW